jgi:cytochrome bd-type quinol oxidase subunit 2
MYAFLNGFDLGAHYANTLTGRAKRKEREAVEMMNAVKSITEGGQS